MKKELKKIKTILPHGACAEIARRAKVSRSQVSSFFCGNPVSLNTQTKILGATKEVLERIKEIRDKALAVAETV